MDPLALIKIAWRLRRLTIPVIVLTILAGGYVLLFGPGTYQASSTYVLVNPKVPSELELAQDSRLARLNSDNPYLRSSDPRLAVQVLITKLGSEATAQQLLRAGLSTEYTVDQVANNNFMVLITAYGPNDGSALATRNWLGAELESQLRTMQKINGADDSYLFTALPVDIQPGATEKVSSRLRLLIVVLFGGAVLLLGALSAGVSWERKRAERLTGPPADAKIPADEPVTTASKQETPSGEAESEEEGIAVVQPSHRRPSRLRDASHSWWPSEGEASDNRTRRENT